jgi:hypothetical protein
MICAPAVHHIRRRGTKLRFVVTVVASTWIGSTATKPQTREPRLSICSDLVNDPILVRLQRCAGHKSVHQGRTAGVSIGIPRARHIRKSSRLTYSGALKA